MVAPCNQRQHRVRYPSTQSFTSNIVTLIDARDERKAVHGAI
jgi:hypothetical protein